jgi:putative NADPH-quinone reductase
MQTTILMFHPDIDQSKANRTLASAASALGDVEVVDMQQLYPKYDIDVAQEAARLLAVKRLVLQFPIHWYSTPPLLQEWQDRVLTQMFYINPETEGNRLAGLPFMIAATAGNHPSAYTSSGTNLFPLTDLLKPLHATAHRCGFDWTDPFLLYQANKLDATGMTKGAARYVERLQNWTTTDTPHAP